MRWVTEVRHQVKNGVDLIKLADSPFGEYQAFSDFEVRELAVRLIVGSEDNDSRQRQWRGPRRGKGGVDWIMHGNVMDDSTIEELASSGIPLVLTLLLLANWADYGHLAGVPRAYIDAARSMLDVTTETLHRAHSAGVQMTIGSDSGFAVTPYGEWLELLMIYAGLSAAEAITAATAAAAITMGCFRTARTSGRSSKVAWSSCSVRKQMLHGRTTAPRSFQPGDLRFEDVVRAGHLSTTQPPGDVVEE